MLITLAPAPAYERTGHTVRRLPLHRPAVSGARGLISDAIVTLVAAHHGIHQRLIQGSILTETSS